MGCSVLVRNVSTGFNNNRLINDFSIIVSLPRPTHRPVARLIVPRRPALPGLCRLNPPPRTALPSAGRKPQAAGRAQRRALPPSVRFCLFNWPRRPCPVPPCICRAGILPPPRRAALPCAGSVCLGIRRPTVAAPRAGRRAACCPNIGALPFLPWQRRSAPPWRAVSSHRRGALP